MRADQVLPRYAKLRAEMIARSRTGNWRAEPRESLVAEAEETLRQGLLSLPERQRPAALQQMEAEVEEISRTEAAMDSVVLIMDWSKRRAEPRVSCPCRPVQECVLFFKEIGWGPDQDPADRATPEELAQCPLQRPRELDLRVIAPKGDVKKWWRRVRAAPARGLLLWYESPERARYVDQVEGSTVPQMMRQARRALDRFRRRATPGPGRAEVVLITTVLLDRLGARE